jgi:hypothetical protein
MGSDDDSARVRRAELLLDYIGKKVREQLSKKEAEKTAEKEA